MSNRCIMCGEKRPIVPEVLKGNPFVYGGTFIYCRDCLDKFLAEVEENWRAKYERGEISRENFEKGMAFSHELRA